MNNDMDKDAVIDLTGKTILIAEDVDLNYYFVERILKKTNAKVIWAQNGEDAVKFCHKYEEIAFIIMDIQMPILNGWEATRQIKKFRPKVPIVALTAYALSDEKEKSYEAGCNGFLTKPVRPKILLSVIQDYLG